jgi:2-methylisocitrate lyase-like PEP mutase family enzyme
MNTIATEKPADAILVIDASAKRYADERSVLAGHVTDFNLSLEQLRQKHLPHIRAAVSRCADLQAVLQAQIEARPDLFVKPRTMTLHGIKLGFQKGKGKLVIENAAKIVERIRALFSKAKADTLIKVKESPDKTALAKLDVKELKKLGVSIVATGDAVFIEAADTEVDKFVATLLEEGSKADSDEKEAA